MEMELFGSQEIFYLLRVLTSYLHLENFITYYSIFEITRHLSIMEEVG